MWVSRGWCDEVVVARVQWIKAEGGSVKGEGEGGGSRVMALSSSLPPSPPAAAAIFLRDILIQDVIGLLTGKGDLITFEKKDKKTSCIIIELSDIKSADRLRCTLWEDIALQFVNHINENPTSEYVIILQFGKMKFFQGMMGVSNTNYTTKLLINEDIDEVKQFRQRLHRDGGSGTSEIAQIFPSPTYCLEDDFLKLNPYKPIADLNDVHQASVFITIGVVKDIVTEHSWWYKGCRQCFQSLREHKYSFYCKKCDAYPSTYIPRYSIRLRVQNDTHSALFIVYDREAARFLNVSAHDLRLAQIERGDEKNAHPTELNAFKDKAFLFKAVVKVEDWNSFHPCAITVLKICSDPLIISSFVAKYKIVDEFNIAGHAGLASDINDVI